MRLVTERRRNKGAGAVVERAPAAVKENMDIWGARPAGFELMAKIKRTFDPAGLLSPGRFVGGL